MDKKLIINAQTGVEKVVKFQKSEETTLLELEGRKELLHEQNRLNCQAQITERYDSFAQFNISHLLTNLGTGEPYTEQEKQEMLSYIDTLRKNYQEKKERISQATSLDELQTILP